MPGLDAKFQVLFHFTSSILRRSRWFSTAIFEHREAPSFLRQHARSFQCKVLNSILCPNDRLLEIGYVSNPNCTFCQVSRETTNHILFECSFSKSFWNTVTVNLLNRLGSRGCTVAHICHGKTYFSTAKLTFPRQNLLFHGKTYFFTAKLPR